MAKTQSTKAPANYAKLADETELIRDGLKSRVEGTRAMLNKHLKDIPERAAIMQTFERHAAWAAQLADVEQRLARYVSLRDRPAESSANTGASN